VIDWPVTFSTVSQAIKLANELRSIDKEVSQADLKLKVAELTGSLADIKLTLTQAKTDAAEKDEEIARLKKLQQRVVDETVELYGYRLEAQRRQGTGCRQSDVRGVSAERWLVDRDIFCAWDRYPAASVSELQSYVRRASHVHRLNMVEISMKAKVMRYKQPYDSASDNERVAQRMAARERIEEMKCIPIEGSEVEVDDSSLVNGQTAVGFVVP
jgi:hypothetical protein